MKLYTLDNIVRSALMDKGYPLHFYLQFLQYGVDCVRQLNFDTLGNIKSVRLPVNSYKAVTIPCDYVDYVRVGIQLGQYVEPMAEKKESFNRLNNFDSLGNKINYGDIEASNGLIPNNWEGYWYTNYINDKGEHLGRIFNNQPGFRNSFVVLRERDEIQLDNGFTGTEIVLDYVSDGLTTDSTNAIHPYAIDAIKAFIFWKSKEHGRQYNLGERSVAKDEYYNQLRVLRGRLNNMTVNDIKRSLAKGYGPVIKN